MSKNHGYELGVLLGVTFGLQTKLMLEHSGGYLPWHDETDESEYIEVERCSDKDKHLLDILASHKQMLMTTLGAYDVRYFGMMSYDDKVKLLKELETKHLIEYEVTGKRRNHGTILIRYIGPPIARTTFRKTKTAKEKFADFICKKGTATLTMINENCKSRETRAIKAEEKSAIFKELEKEGLIKIEVVPTKPLSTTILTWMGDL
jgi:hypothetical protein